MLNSRFRNTSGLQLEIQNLRNRNRTLNQVCSKNIKERGDNCCMESLRVDFHKDYRWSFVISGDWSLGKIMPENAYAHILQQFGIRRCCKPQTTVALEIYYMDEINNFVLGTLPKMMVQRCGCT